MFTSKEWLIKGKEKRFWIPLGVHVIYSKEKKKRFWIPLGVRVMYSSISDLISPLNIHVLSMYIIYIKKWHLEWKMIRILCKVLKKEVSRNESLWCEENQSRVSDEYM